MTHSIGAALDYPEGSKRRPAIGDGKPHIYCTFGTVYNRQPRLLTTLSQSLSSLDVEATISVGPNVDANGIARGSKIRIERFVTQFEVLAKSSAVICHAGMGTALSGLPFVAIPLGANQNRVAKHATEAGTAITIIAGEGSGPFVDAESLNPLQITSALQEVLENPRYRERAEQVGNELRESWQAGNSVRLLRQLAETGEPVVRREPGLEQSLSAGHTPFAPSRTRRSAAPRWPTFGSGGSVVSMRSVQSSPARSC